MGIFVNPFTHNDHQTFPGVLVPLEDVYGASRPASGTEEKKADSGSEEKGVAASPSPDARSSAIEKLRAEVETDLQSGGVDTAYDRMSWAIAFFAGSHELSFFIFANLSFYHCQRGAATFVHGLAPSQHSIAEKMDLIYDI